MALFDGSYDLLLVLVCNCKYPSIHPFINTHKAAVIIKYKNTQSTMNRKIYKKNKIKNSNKSSTNRAYNE